MRKIVGCIKKADKDFNLISDGDRIAVGVSGGKDSVLLLYALYLYQQMHVKNFDIIGIHINMGFPNMNFSNVDEFFSKINIPLVHEDSDIYEILKLNAEEDGSLPCSLCSKFKKAAVIEAAKKLGFSKIAFAHHADDAIETLFLNAIYGGRLATFKPNMYLDRSETTFVRPFAYVYETDVVNAFHNKEIPVVVSTCPMDGYTKRQEIKELLQSIYSSYPMAKQNFLKMLHNNEKIDLWVKELTKSAKGL